MRGSALHSHSESAELVVRTAKAGASASGRAAEVDARTEGLWELMRSLGPTKEGAEGR